jgi:hypothetical protein
MWDGWNTAKNATTTGTITSTGSLVDFSTVTSVKLPAGTTINGTTQGTYAVNGSAAGLALTAAQSGQIFLFDTAAGKAYVLPTAAKGLEFTFLVTTSVTSVGDSVATFATGSQFILGAVEVLSIATASPAGFAANGTSNSTITMSGTTTGGLIGTILTYIGLSTTQWFVTGTIYGSGTLATPIS